MNKPSAIKILLLEDNDSDAILINRYLDKVSLSLGVEFRVIRAEGKMDYYHIINRENPKLIIADYKLDDILGDEALSYAKRNLPHIPFIFVTGTLNSEELAAQTILNGASGFVLKSNLPRLKEIFPQILKEIKDGELVVKLDEEIKDLSTSLNSLYKQLRDLRGQTNSTRRVERDSEINETLIEINQHLHKRQDLITQQNSILDKFIYSSIQENNKA